MVIDVPIGRRELEEWLEVLDEAEASFGRDEMLSVRERAELLERVRDIRRRLEECRAVAERHWARMKELRY